MEQFDIAKPAVVPGVAPAQTTRGVIHSCLANRWALIIGAVAIVVAGLALGWNWLTAVGLAPLIVAAAPCLIMCALGMCMMSRGMSSNATQNSAEPAKSAEPPPSIQPDEQTM